MCVQLRAPLMASIETNAVGDHVSLLCMEGACVDDDDREDDGRTKCGNDDEYGYADEASMFVQEESTPWQVRHTFCTLMEREKHYLPEPDFFLKLQEGTGIDGIARKEAVCWLLKMHKLFKFSAHTASLSINYLDRFLSLYQLPNGRAWALQLLSVACLSLAAKMEEIEVPVLSDLQIGSELVFEPRIVKRMELLVLVTLGWRMNAVTPVSYTNHLIKGLGLPIITKRALISKANEFFLSSIQEMRFLQFRPSSMGVAATLCAIQQNVHVDFSEQRKSLLCVMPREAEAELISCHALLSELFSSLCTNSIDKGDNQCGISVPQSPVAVLDASFSSNSMGNITISNNNSHSCCPPISSPSPPKKRRTDDPS